MLEVMLEAGLSAGLEALLPIRGLPNERNRCKKRGEILYGRRIGDFSFQKAHFKENEKNGMGKLYLSVRHVIKICLFTFSLKERTILY